MLAFIDTISRSRVGGCFGEADYFQPDIRIIAEAFVLKS